MRLSTGSARWLGPAAAASFLVLAVLVATGTTNGLDRYDLEHWLISSSGITESSTTLGDLLTPDTHGRALAVVLNVWVYPASAFLSLVILAAVGAELRSRGQTRAAVGWVALLVAGTAFELVGKGLISRPAIHPHIPEPLDFTHSFPSGHTIRAFIVAAALAYTWPRVQRGAALWAATVTLALLPTSAHTPTDVAGGALAATALIMFTVPTFAGDPAG